MELILALLSYLPVADLFSHGVSSEPFPFLYDAGQAVGALHFVARGFVWLSEATPWKGDDGPAKAFLGWTTSAAEWVARLMGALQKGK